MSSSPTFADASPSGDRVLVLDDLAAGYDGEPVVQGIRGVVRAGEALALIGPNGAGKTTLFRAVLGLVPVLGGTVEVLGATPRAARSQVAYVPQAGVLDPSFPVSAFDVVMMGRTRSVGWFRRAGRHDRRLVTEALERVGLSDDRDRRFGLLSGGQRQRVLLARALAQQSSLMLLDEPFNGVDVNTVEIVVEVLAGQRAEGVAIVMSTHDFDLARRTSGLVCVVNRRQFGFGAIDSVLTAAVLTDAFGGHALSTNGAVVTA